jgi:predicted phage-related endonuclease
MDEPISDYPRHRVTPSGVKAMYRASKGPAEFKTVSEYAVDGSPPFADWTEEEPSSHALVQMHHTLSVLDKPRGLIVALVGFSKLWTYEIERDPALDRVLLARESRFWDWVDTNTQPPIHESEASAAALAALFPQDDGTEIELDQEMAWPWFERLHNARVDKKISENEIKLAEVPIKEAMGSSTKAVIGDRGEFIWKTTKSGARPLRLKRKE